MYKHTKQKQQQGSRRYLQPDKDLAKSTAPTLVEQWNAPLEQTIESDIAFDSFLISNGVKLC